MNREWLPPAEVDLYRRHGVGRRHAPRRARRALGRAAGVWMVASLLWVTAPPELHAQPAVAPAPPAAARPAAVAALLLDSLIAADGIPGLSAAVAVSGDVVWSKGAGLADVENRAPVTPLTRFRIGSVSKPLTAAALALLVEEGRLDLDAPVQDYLPDFPAKRWPLTTRQLAGHLGGVRHYDGNEFLSTRRYATVREGLEIFAADTLLFEPGTRYAYSSYGWNLISAVIEAAAGEPFLEFMQRRVIGPLGLRHTVADHADSLVAFRTRFYLRAEVGTLLNAPYVDNSYKWAGGGYLSTPEDLVRFADAHMGGAFLRPETVELLFTSQQTVAGEETGYGIGWRTSRDEQGRRVVAHGGGSVGGTTILLLYPEERLAVAAVANLTGAGSVGPLAQRLAELFRGAPQAAPR